MIASSRLLVVDAASKRANIGVLDGDRVVARREADPESGLADLLALLVEQCLHQAGIAPSALDGIVVTVGPGSFTGLRAALALAAGIGLAVGIPVHGVTVDEAFAQMLPGLGRSLWVVTFARRGRVFLARDGVIETVDDDALPPPDRPIALAGDRAEQAADRLAGDGHDVVLTDARFPTVAAIAAALRCRLAAGIAPLPPYPLYIDPPEARVPATGVRPLLEL